MSSSFKREVARELNGVKTKLNSAMTNTLLDGLGFVTARSAVDTGRYRAAWNISVDTPDDSVPAEKKKPKGHTKGTDIYGYRARARMLFDITKNKSIILSNNVEYAQYVDAKYGDRLRAFGKMRLALKRRLRAIK